MQMAYKSYHVCSFLPDWLLFSVADECEIDTSPREMCIYMTAHFPVIQIYP